MSWSINMPINVNMNIFVTEHSDGWTSYPDGFTTICHLPQDAEGIFDVRGWYPQGPEGTSHDWCHSSKSTWREAGSQALSQFKVFQGLKVIITSQSYYKMCTSSSTILRMRTNITCWMVCSTIPWPLVKWKRWARKWSPSTLPNTFSFKKWNAIHGTKLLRLYQIIPRSKL